MGDMVDMGDMCGYGRYGCIWAIRHFLVTRLNRTMRFSSRNIGIPLSLVQILEQNVVIWMLYGTI